MLVLVSLITLSSLSLSCKKPESSAPNPDIYADDTGRGSEVLGRAINEALQAKDATALLKLTAPPTVAKCERKSAAEFAARWKEKNKTKLQTVGAISDIEKVAAGAQHKHSHCTAQQNVTFGQILLYMDTSGETAKANPPPLSPFWIVKAGDDPSPMRGWYLADPLAY